MNKFSKRSLRNREGVDPRLIEISDLAITISKVDFGIPNDGGLRNDAQQKELFDKFLSKADGVYNKSKHQSGEALDFFAYVDGKASWDVGDLAQVAAAFLQAAIILGYKIRWGGLWKRFNKGRGDNPHVELRD